MTMTATGKFLCMAHRFMLLWLNPFGLSVDSEGWWLEHCMSYLRVGLSARVLKTFPGLGYFNSEVGVV